MSLVHANLTGAKLCRADLSARSGQDWITDLSGTNLQGADLSYANLNGAVLVKANLQGADLTGNWRDRANFQGAIMPDGSVHD